MVHPPVWRYFIVWISYEGTPHGAWTLHREEVVRRTKLRTIADIERLEEDVRLTWGPERNHLVLNFILLGEGEQ